MNRKAKRRKLRGRRAAHQDPRIALPSTMIREMDEVARAFGQTRSELVEAAVRSWIGMVRSED